jgi:succinate-semialdehyde dehydrogenase/glutarate-semialdehyde dehydrogenase
LLFSKDKARAEKVAEQLDVGMTNVNWIGEGAQLPSAGPSAQASAVSSAP